MKGREKKITSYIYSYICVFKSRSLATYNETISINFKQPKLFA